jgi:hypothetical protein
MKLFRYRKLSVNSLVGITKAKRKLRKATGISTVERYTKPSRIKQHYKQKLGLYSPLATTVRQTSKGNFPSFLRLFKRKK